MASTPLPLLSSGNSPVANGFALKRDPLAFFQRLARENGPLARFDLVDRSIYFVNDPALVRDVLVAKETYFRKWAFNGSFRVIFGSGLIGSGGELHRQMQKIAQPSFQQNRLEEYARTMVGLTIETMRGWQEGPLDLSSELIPLTLEIVGQVLLSRSLREFAPRIIAASDTLQRFSNQIGASVEIDRDYKAAGEEMTNVARELLAERGQRAEGGDLFAHLLQTHGADTDQVYEELRTFILAGHITSANVLAAALTLLAQNPASEAKLYAELDSVLADRPPEFGDLVRLPFCEMVVRETLRLFPPVWVLGREVVEEVELGGETLPVDAKLVISPYVFHHDARFFSDPETFRPERWNEPAPKFTYIPFSTGPRSCIGERFAMVEIVLLLATIAQRWKFHELSPPHDAGWTPQIIYWPRRGVSLGAERRR